MNTLLTIVGICLLCPLSVLGQNDNHWERYQCRTLNEVIRIHRDSDVFKSIESKKKAMLLTGEDFASQVKLVYVGRQRPASDVTQVLLKTWRKSFPGYGAPQDEFKTEVLFKEGSAKYWLVVQNGLLDPIAKELKEGDVVNAYVIWIGSIRTKAGWEWLFALNEFVNCPEGKADCSL